MIASAETVRERSNGHKKKNGSASRNHKKVKPLEVTHEHLFLSGRPSIRDFLRYVKSNATNPPGEDALITEWEAARDVVRRLEQEEAGAADNPPIIQMDVQGRHKPFLVRLLKDPVLQNSFNSVPTEIAYVELDRLVVYQKHIDLTHVRELKKKIGLAPNEEEIFNICLPHDHPCPPVKWSRMSGGSYVFVSPSNDLRFLGPLQLKSKHLKGNPAHGNPAGIVGLAVGFGSNFLNAFYVENRLILHNGSHRAYALRDMGITHVPCIIQHVVTRDQFEVVAPSKITTHADYYLKHPRPSMLKDYFNPRLRKVMEVHRRLRQITMKFEVNEGEVPAL